MLLKTLKTRQNRNPKKTRLKQEKTIKYAFSYWLVEKVANCRQGAKRAWHTVSEVLEIFRFVDLLGVVTEMARPLPTNWSGM
jgi:hypothetical protein